MVARVELGVCHHIKIAPLRGYYHSYLFMNKVLVSMLNAVFYQVLYRNYFEPKLFGHLDQVRQSRHFTIFLHNFADHARWFQTGQHGHVNSRLSMPRSAQHTAILGYQWKNVPRASQRRKARWLD